MPKTDIDTSDLRPIVIRHHYSGVWIGYLVGPGTFENLVKIIGRRVWSWSGGRLECSQLAKHGCRESDKLGEWEVVEIAVGRADGLVELRTIDRDVVEASKKFEAAVV
jgi:hypothetical protein